MAVGITNTANPASAGTGTTISYNTVDIGAAAHDRIVVLCVGVEAVSGAISSATINYGGGAVAMNASTNGIQGALGARVFWRQAPVGTTADFAVTFGASVNTANLQHIAVYRVTGAQGAAASSSSTGDTDADPISSGAITIPANGGCVAVYAGAANATGRTWTGITEGLDTATGAFDFGTGTSVTAGTPTITVSGANQEDAALAWVNFAVNASVERVPPQGDLVFSPTAPTVSPPDIRPDRVDLVISPSQSAIGMSKDLNTVDLVISTTAPIVESLVEIHLDPPRVDLVITPTAPTAFVAVASDPPRVDLVLSTTAPTVDFVLPGTEISPAHVDLVISPSQAAIGTSKDLNAADLVLSTTVPTVSTVLDTPISPARVDLVISATAPIVVAGASQGISPAAANLTISSLAPDAGLGSDIPVGQLVISTTAPIVAHAQNDHEFVPPLVDLVISGQQPAIGTSKALDSVDLVISATAPTTVVGLPSVAADPPAVDLVISGTAPTVLADAAISPPRVDLVISSTAPTAFVEVYADPPRVDLVISATAPTSVLGLFADPPSVELVISATAPSVTEAEAGEIVPATVELVISATAPTAFVEVHADPPRVDLAISTTAPTALRSLYVDPPRVDLVISTTAPTAAVEVGSVAVSPATIDLILSCSTPILLVAGVSAEIAVDVGGKARRGAKKRRRTGDDDLTEEELRYMFRKLAELKKAKSEREKQKAAKALEIALAQAANDDDAAEVISDTIEEAYGTPIGSLTDFSGILRDIELLTAIVSNLERVAKESVQFARDEDDVEALMLAL